jgi:hypothetical protein
MRRITLLGLGRGKFNQQGWKKAVESEQGGTAPPGDRNDGEHEWTSA